MGRFARRYNEDAAGQANCAALHFTALAAPANRNDGQARADRSNSVQQTRYVASITVGAGDGTITVTLTPSAQPASGNLVFTGTVSAAGMQWDCKTGTTITAKYLPGNCR